MKRAILKIRVLKASQNPVQGLKLALQVFALEEMFWHTPATSETNENGYAEFIMEQDDEELLKSGLLGLRVVEDNSKERDVKILSFGGYSRIDRKNTELTIDFGEVILLGDCLLYTSPSPRDQRGSRMPSSA